MLEPDAWSRNRSHWQERQVSTTLGVADKMAGNGWVREDGEEDTVTELPLEQWLRKEGGEFVRQFVRGFSRAAAVYAGVRTFTAFMKNPFRKSMPPVLRAAVAKDCLRFATFFGLYPSLYRFTVALLRRYRKHKDGWNYGIAGGVAGLSLALEADSRRKTLAFIAAARALGAGATTLVAREVVKGVPHAYTLSFCACCAVLVTCVARFPHLLPHSYYLSVIQWSRDYSHDILEELFRRPGSRFLLCSDVGMHQGACTRHALEDFVRSLPGFAKLYLPIHLVPVLLFKRKMLQTKPQYVLTSLAENLTCSTLFISTMVLIAKYVICVLRHASGRPPPLPVYIPCVAGFLCGVSVLWERVTRRKELVLFLIPQLLNALLMLVKSSPRGRQLHVPHGFVFMFAVAMGVIMHAYEREPRSLTLLMTGVLKFFVGPPLERKQEKSVQNGGVRRPRKVMFSSDV